MKDCEQASLNMESNIKFSVWVSFFEIYNECIYDLFVPVSSKFQKRKILRLSQDIKGYSFIKGILMSIFYFIVLKFFSRLCYSYRNTNWKFKSFIFRLHYVIFIFILIINIKIVREVCALEVCLRGLV